MKPMYIFQGHSGLVHGLYILGTSPDPCAVTPFHTRLQTKLCQIHLHYHFCLHTQRFVTFKGVSVDLLTRTRPVVGKIERKTLDNLIFPLYGCSNIPPGGIRKKIWLVLQSRHGGLIDKEKRKESYLTPRPPHWPRQYSKAPHVD